MKENARFVDQFNHLISKGHEKLTLTTHAKLAKIQNLSGEMFLGILMDRSIVIPFTANTDTEETIKNIVSVNNMCLQRKLNESHAEVACKLMGLNFNGENSGFYSDGTALAHSNIMILHIYPKGYINTQEQFTEDVTKMFNERNCVVSIEDTD